MNDVAAIRTKKLYIEIGKRIRHIRHDKRLSLDELAKKTGFAKSYLSQIENLKREPSIGTLTKIAYALNVNALYLISGINPSEEEELITIVKPHERKAVIRPSSGTDIRYESITYKKRNRLMDAYIVEVGFEFPPGLMAHEGQELVYVLEGKQEFVYDGRSYIVEEGDCYYFESRKSHYPRSIGNKPSKALVVFTGKV